MAISYYRFIDDLGGDILVLPTDGLWHMTSEGSHLYSIFCQQFRTANSMTFAAAGHACPRAIPHQSRAFLCSARIAFAASAGLELGMC